MKLQSEGFADGFYIVEFLPCEEFYFAYDGLSEVARVEYFGYRARGATHVTVGGCLFVDGVTQFESFFYGARTQVEEVFYYFGNFSIALLDVRFTVSIYVDAYRLGYTYGV